MRIVHVITRLINGGADENTVASCNWAAGQGHEVVLVHGARTQPEICAKLHPGVRVVAVPDLVRDISPLRDLRAVLRLRRLLIGLRPDIVHTHTSKAGVVGRLAARLAGCRAIVHGVHIAPFLTVGPVERLAYLVAERLVARWTCAFISVSEGMRRAYLDAGIGPAERHHLVRSGMAIGAFGGAPPPEDWRGLLGVPDGAERPPVVLMLAALEGRKRHRAFIGHLDRLFVRHPQARVVLAGEGPERPAIMRAIARCARPENVRLVGFHPHPEKLVAMADVAVLCSEREGLPRAVVQYVAGGCPPVVSRLPGIGEIVEDGINGHVLEPGDIAGLVDRVGDLIADPARRSRLAAACRSRDLSAWSIEAMCGRQDRIYAAVLDGLARKGGAGAFDVAVER